MITETISFTIMKLHLPLSLLAVVLASFQVCAKTFSLSYETTKWVKDPETGLYACHLPFSLYGRGDATEVAEWDIAGGGYWTIDANLNYSNTPEGWLSTIPGGAVASDAADFMLRWTRNQFEFSGFRGNQTVSSGGDHWTTAELKVVNSGDTSKVDLDVRANEGDGGNYHPDEVDNTNDPNPVKWADRHSAIRDLYSSVSGLSVMVSATLVLAETDEYAVAHSGCALGASYRNGSGLLQVYDDLTHSPNNRTSVPVLNTDEGVRAKELFLSDNPNGRNTLRFVSTGLQNIRANEDSSFHNVTVQAGGEVSTGGDFYAGGIKVDERATDYSLRVDGDATFGKTIGENAGSAVFVFNESFTLSGTGTVTWDCTNVDFRVAEGKTVTWNMSGGADVGDPAVKLYMKGLDAITGDEVYTAGGTLKLGGSNSLGTGDISVFGMTLDVGSAKLEKGHINLYSVSEDKIGSNLVVGSGGEITSKVRINYTTEGSEDDHLEADDRAQITGGDFDLGGLDAKNLTYADMHRGGCITGLKAGSTLTIKDDEDNVLHSADDSFRFLVGEDNITIADGRDAAPRGGKYLVNFLPGEKGKIDFGGTGSSTRVKLYFTVDAVRKILGIQKGKTPEENVYDVKDGYVDIWFTNGTMPYDELAAKPGDLAAIKEWFDRHFVLADGINGGVTEEFNGWGDITGDGKTWGQWVTDEDGKPLESLPGNGDGDERFEFENELWDMGGDAETAGHVIYDTYSGVGDGGIIRVFLSVSGIYIADVHGENTNAGHLNDERWKQVWVDTTLTVDFTSANYAELGETFTLRNLSSGDAEHKGDLVVTNSSGKEGLGLIIDQQIDEYGDPVAANDGTLNGSIIFESDSRFDLSKRGAANLIVTGNVQNADVLKVEEGELEIRGNVDAVELRVEGEDPTEGDEEHVENVLVLEGLDNKAEKIGGIGEGAELVIDGTLTLSGDSTLGPDSGGGTLRGKGALCTEGKFDASGIELDGIAVGIGEKGSLITSPDGAKISALCGNVTEGEGLVLRGNLTIDSTKTNYDGADALYIGAIKSEKDGVTITVTGDNTKQAFCSSGSESVNLVVEKAANLTLIGVNDANADPSVTPLPPAAAKYGAINVRNGGTLTVSAPSASAEAPIVTQLTTGSLTVGEGGTLEVLYNLTPTDGSIKDEALSASGPAVVTDEIEWEKGAKLKLGNLGINFFNLLHPEDLTDFKILEVTGMEQSELSEMMQDIVFEWKDSFSVFWQNAKLGVDGDTIIVNATAREGNTLSQFADKEANPQAGAELLWAARNSEEMNSIPEKGKELPLIQQVMGYVAANFTKNSAEISKLYAAVAGSTVPITGTAQRDALRSQVLRMRDHASSMGLDPSASYQSLPFTHFWVEASGDFTNLNDDGYQSGYKYNAWGGTIGMEMDISERTSFGAGITALYGDLDGGCTDTADGNLDSYYLSLMAHVSRHRWGHTLVGVIGLNSADLDRTVRYGAASYKASGSTDGWGAGLMYELTYDIPLNAEHTQVLQPLVAASVMHTTLDGYKESGAQGIGLDVGEQEWTTSTVSVGLRWISALGASLFNTSAQLELRAAVAQDIGDSQGEASVGLQANPGFRQTIKSAEVGKTGAQFGAALRMPISENTMLYFNLGADLRSGMNSWNVTAGAKYSF